ncbi:phage tail protein [Stenotrophomonas maltophilia]|uniref:phage tail protein n=1 Tax=Stenotrophomonas maltophilia TaxID=40324 RepID=UPI000810EBAD|nr:phage tail protein [Stenotrophomonas maltophilia]MCU1064322.1 phage tail protein [Stenotrophomonas maltophilia]OCK46542.1 oxidoreductase [Stenotrophomonas maltophilia]PJK95719.1 oxidoreductase [Stenotrophomonas maltophilia]
MMMSYGTFVFSLPTAAYEQLQRQMSWRHASSERLHARPARQYVGLGEDTISLQGVIAGELAANLDVLDELRALADEGKPQALVEGTGRVYGAYLLVSLNETRKELFADGTPRLIEFQMQLERDDDGAAAEALA